MKVRIKDFYDKYIIEDLEKKHGEENDDEKEKKRFVVWKLRSIILAFFLIWAFSGVSVYFILSRWEDRGTFGDMFGAVNALFSAFAFAGLVYTLFVQRYELSLQRKELELQRKEVKRNGDQLEEQKNVMLQQSFENTFFKLIELHHNLIESISHSDGHTGRKAVELLRVSLKNKVRHSKLDKELLDSISEFMKGQEGKFIKQFLNNFYCLLLLIAQHCSKTNTDVSNSDYTIITLSQLSDDEKFIIFYTMGYKESTQWLLEKFIALEELNPEAGDHANWMRRLNTK